MNALTEDEARRHLATAGIRRPLGTAGQVAWLDSLEAGVPDFVAALEWALVHDPLEALRATVGLHDLLQLRARKAWTGTTSPRRWNASVVGPPSTTNSCVSGRCPPRTEPASSSTPNSN